MTRDFPKMSCRLRNSAVWNLACISWRRISRIEPVGVLQPVLSGYVSPGRDIEAVARRVRHRMGDVARRGYWRKLLNHYMRLPDSVRAFDRTDRSDRRVIDKTVFVPRPSSMCPSRDEAYAAALADPLAYRK